MATPVNAPAERCQAYQRPGTPEERPCQSAARHSVTVEGMPRACCAMHRNGAGKATRWQPLATWTLRPEEAGTSIPGWVRVQTGAPTLAALAQAYPAETAFTCLSGDEYRAGERLEAAEAEDPHAYRVAAEQAADEPARLLRGPDPDFPPPVEPAARAAQLALAIPSDSVRRPTRTARGTP